MRLTPSGSTVREEVREEVRAGAEVRVGVRVEVREAGARVGVGVEGWGWRTAASAVDRGIGHERC